ncbi:unnamed protein product, partial [Sphacelaria rigidula]
SKISCSISALSWLCVPHGRADKIGPAFSLGGNGRAKQVDALGLSRERTLYNLTRVKARLAHTLYNAKHEKKCTKNTPSCSHGLVSLLACHVQRRSNLIAFKFDGGCHWSGSSCQTRQGVWRLVVCLTPHRHHRPVSTIQLS